MSFVRRLLYRVLRFSAWLLRGPFTAGSCAVVMRSSGEILLVQNRLRGNAWGLPGGFWKRNETPEEGLRRELSEEIGLTGDYIITPIDQYRQDQAPHLDFLYCVYVEDSFVPGGRDRKEIRRTAWFSLSNLPALLPEASLALQKASRKGVVSM
jgi:ADP-ribose pyrophosphatase YjhB (NUDIX family)